MPWCWQREAERRFGCYWEKKRQRCLESPDVARGWRTSWRLTAEMTSAATLLSADGGQRQRGHGRRLPSLRHRGALPSQIPTALVSSSEPVPGYRTTEDKSWDICRNKMLHSKTLSLKGLFCGNQTPPRRQKAFTAFRVTQKKKKVPEMMAPNAQPAHVTVAQKAGQRKDVCHSVNLNQMWGPRLSLPHTKSLSFVCSVICFMPDKIMSWNYPPPLKITNVD